MANRELERIRADIEALRKTIAGARQRPVIEYADRADVPRLLTEAETQGRIAPGYGALVVPEDAPSVEEWELLCKSTRLQNP